jgi:dipeptidyl aminopeptidase/acylaminoacyl peptidase
VRVTDGKVRQITGTRGSEYAPAWSPDGSKIAYLAGVRSLTTQESSAEDPHLWVIPAESGSGRQLAAALDRRAMGVAWAPDEPTVYFTVQDRGSTVLYRVGADGAGLELVLSDRGNVGAFSTGRGRRVAYAFHGVSGPAEVFLKQGQEAARPVTKLNAELLAGRDVSVPEAFEFSSFDGTPVEGFLTPLRRPPGRKVPVVVNIHGGPHASRDRPSFTSRRFTRAKATRW